MPNSRMVDARKTSLQRRPCGIIRIAALWVLCRYRHNGHATGHASRLARNLANPFGSKDYAREELVAEMGSAFLCAALGIVPTVRHADYLGAWLEVLREDNRAIFRAASMASKAAEWLLARHRDARSPSSPPSSPLSSSPSAPPSLPASGPGMAGHLEAAGQRGAGGATCEPGRAGA